ncbi:hypothetical protein HDU76_012186, partial [Blyttiomyces sp. JEL0837]
DIDATALGNAALKSACLMGHQDVVELLLAVESVRMLLVKDEDNEVLSLACQHGQLEVVKFLLEVEGIDIARSRKHAMTVAAENGKYAVVKFLLSLKDFDPSSPGDALKIASKYGHTAVVELLESAGCKIEELQRS